jgi:hypothetical protein
MKTNAKTNNAKTTTKKVAATKNEILVSINLLNEAKKETAKIQKEDVITQREIERTAKREQAQKLKEAKQRKAENKKDVVAYWLNATQSKSAVKKFCANNEALLMPFINDINEIYNTTYNAGAINGTLENFAFIHELNKIDFDGNIVEEKRDVVSIRFYLTLLERKAKFIDYNSAEFKKESAKSLTAKCKSATAKQFDKICAEFKNELSAANYKKALNVINNAKTETLSNSKFLNFVQKSFENVKNPVIVPTKILTK